MQLKRFPRFKLLHGDQIGAVSIYS